MENTIQEKKNLATSKSKKQYAIEVYQSIGQWSYGTCEVVCIKTLFTDFGS